MAPFVCTPLDRSRETRPAIALAPDAAASTAPRPTFVTMANAPLTGRDGRSCRVDSTKSRRGKFSYKGIDQYLGVICPSGNTSDWGWRVVTGEGNPVTGTPTAPTAAVDTNTTQLATTALVLAQAASATPLIDGTATVGTSTGFARGDHVHPTDTTRAPLASPALTGTQSHNPIAVSRGGPMNNRADLSLWRLELDAASGARKPLGPSPKCRTTASTAR